MNRVNIKHLTLSAYGRIVILGFSVNFILGSFSLEKNTVTSWEENEVISHIVHDIKIVILWRACILTAFIHSSTGPVVHPFASRHEGPGFNPQGKLM
jgi:hypothetical protein